MKKPKVAPPQVKFQAALEAIKQEFSPHLPPPFPGLFPVANAGFS